MKKNDEIQLDNVQPPIETEFLLSIAEFCAQVSATDFRVELIGAFFSEEKRMNRQRDTASAYRSRLNAFAVQPA